MWSRFRRVSNTSPNKLPPFTVNGVFLTDNTEKVCALNEHFSTVGEESKSDDFDEDYRSFVESSNRDHSYCFETRAGEGFPECDLISEREVASCIRALKLHKACGPDGIHPEMLRNGGPLVIKSLAFLFERSWELGYLPSGWRTANIVAIAKLSSPKAPSDFRPISLLSVVGKLMDKIVTRRLSFVAESRNWFSIFQGTFRRRRDANDQLLFFSQRIYDAFASGQSCVTAFIDISKAYDRVWRDGLIFRLIQLGVRGRLLSWIRAFVTDRTARVQYAEVGSPLRAYNYGIPQGSCISPTLFNVFVSDIFDCFDFCHDTDQDTDLDREISLFADDIRASVYCKNPQEGCRLLTATLLRVRHWASRKRISFSRTKMVWTLFGRLRPERGLSVSLGEIHLKFDPHPKYLGVWWDRTLSFSENISQRRAKAWRALNFVRRVSGPYWGASFSTTHKLYTTFVRPHLESACMIWDGAGESHKHRLDRIQRAALLAMSGAAFSSSTSSLEVYCNVPSLQDRRDLLVASALHRISRLNEEHPIFRLFRMWRPCNSSRRSFFARATALLARLTRFSDFSDGGLEWGEPFPDPDNPQWPLQEMPFTVTLGKSKASHDHYVSSIPFSSPMLVYTDGSASGNPGRCGCAVSVSFCERSWLISRRVGFGTSLTAELYALFLAFTEILATVGPLPPVYVFTDCRVAISLVCGTFSPAGSFELVNSIRNLVQVTGERTFLRVIWIPSHLGIPGNEIADHAAKAITSSFSDCSPIPKQPLVPLSVSKALCRQQILERWQRRWLSEFGSHLGIDSLSRLRVTVQRWRVVPLGSRAAQTCLARLRIGHCKLSAHRARFDSSVSHLCDCGHIETVSHFLLSCPLYHLPRERMLHTIRAFYDGVVNEEVLLGSSESPKSIADMSKVVNAVFDFVKDTGRSV